MNSFLQQCKSINNSENKSSNTYLQDFFPATASCHAFLLCWWCAGKTVKAFTEWHIVAQGWGWLGDITGSLGWPSHYTGILRIFTWQSWVLGIKCIKGTVDATLNSLFQIPNPFWVCSGSLHICFCGCVQMLGVAWRWKGALPHQVLPVTVRRNNEDDDNGCCQPQSKEDGKACHHTLEMLLYNDKRENKHQTVWLKVYM